MFRSVPVGEAKLILPATELIVPEFTTFGAEIVKLFCACISGAAALTPAGSALVTVLPARIFKPPELLITPLFVIELTASSVKLKFGTMLPNHDDPEGILEVIK